ncbi:MAG: RIP metalloprotease RseP [Muribaculaceae bacterium]|nr:RIP metalloprotease RseP [Muribaculaceae bacterium]
MDVFLIKALQLILAFAILVIIHEFGHFLFARIFGIKVERFYIFFNPKFSLFKWKPKEYAKCLSKNTPYDSELPAEAKSEESADASKPVEGVEGVKSEEAASDKKKKKKGFWNDTEYGIGWLPLGGYCKIAGMIDESMDKEQMAKPPQEWEFRSKPAWQRLLVMIAGVLFNFLLAILIYAGIVYATGEKYVTFKEAKAGMHFSPEAQKIGFKDGDIPLTADGKPLDNPLEGRMEMLQASRVEVLRGTDTVTIAIPEKFLFRIEEETKRGETPIMFMDYRIPTKVTQVMAGEGAAKGGVKEGDLIIAVDSVATPYLLTFLETLPGHDNQTVNLTVVRPRGAAVDTIILPVALNAGSKMGIGLEVDPSAFYKADEKRYSLLGSVPRGVQMGTEKLTSYVKSMKLVFTKEGAQSVGGFGAIGSIFPEKWDWIAFWNIAAFLSVALAFMNILPIPALDGGHVMFLLYEVIFRRPPNQKFMEWAQMIGMGLLILLLLYANGMDIVRLFR